MNRTIRLEHDSPRPGQPLSIRALLTLAGTPPTDRDRVPLSLALVLDRSGSMQGPKIAAAREAAALAVRRLWPEDVVSVVAYDDAVEVVAEPATGDAQHHLTHQIGAIEPRGMTNLSGGWLKGRELAARDAPDGAVRRVLLLTDGLANQGVTDPGALMGLCRKAAEEGVTTTTIGFGRDFDETLLRSMADAGGGATYYIEEPDQAPGVFEEELEGLLSLSAQNVSATVAVRDAVRLAAVRHSYPSAETDDGALRLEMGDLYAREPKKLLLELLVDPVPESGDVELATLTLHADVLESGGGIIHRETTLPVVLDAEGGARVDPEVRRETLLLDAADAREQALERQDRGDYGGAAEVLREARMKLRESGFDDDARLAEEAADLQGMADRVAEAPMSPADRKYMSQRAYDSSRARGASYRRISREERMRREEQRAGRDDDA